MITLKNRLVAGLVCAALTTSSLSLAQNNASRADSLFREGREAFKRQDYPTACQKFADSYALDESPGTLLNLGNCEEKIGRVGLAWRHLSDAIEQLPSTDDRLPVAKKLLESLNTRVGRLTITFKNAEGSTVKVRLDGVEVPARQRRGSLAVDPGEHVVQGVTSDDREARQVVQVPAGQSRDVPLDFPALDNPTPARPSSGNATPARQPPTPPPASQSPGSTQRVLGYVSGGLGLVGLGVGIGFGLRTRSLNDEARGICNLPGSSPCPTQEAQVQAQGKRDDAKSASTVSTAGFIAGGVLLSLGVVLVLTAPSSTSSTAIQLRVVPSIHPQLASLSLTGAWK